jgi:hypothetical protein
MGVEQQRAAANAFEGMCDFQIVEEAAAGKNIFEPLA